jgi:hypothetical protein
VATTEMSQEEIDEVNAAFVRQAQAMKREEILGRFVYRAPTEAQRALLNEYHALLMQQVEFLVDKLPDSRDRAVALTSLEETRMKVNKAIVFSKVG